MYIQQKGIAIEGNWGSHTEYFFSLCKAYFNVALTRPVACNKQCKQLRQRMLADPLRWSHSYLTHVISERMRQSKKNTQEQQLVNMTLGSCMSDYYCFGIPAYEMGFIDEVEWNLFTDLYTEAKKQQAAINGFIYLRTQPEWHISEHTQSSVDARIEIYFIKVHEAHERLFSGKQVVGQKLADIPVLILEFPPEIEKQKEIQEELMEEVAQFMGSLMDYGQETESWQLNL